MCVENCQIKLKKLQGQAAFVKKSTSCFTADANLMQMQQAPIAMYGIRKHGINF